MINVTAFTDESKTVNDVLIHLFFQLQPLPHSSPSCFTFYCIPISYNEWHRILIFNQNAYIILFLYSKVPYSKNNGFCCTLIFIDASLIQETNYTRTLLWPQTERTQLPPLFIAVLGTSHLTKSLFTSWLLFSSSPRFSHHACLLDKWSSGNKT